MPVARLSASVVQFGSMAVGASFTTTLACGSGPLRTTSLRKPQKPMTCQNIAPIRKPAKPHTSGAARLPKNPPLPISRTRSSRRWRDRGAGADAAVSM